MKLLLIDDDAFLRDMYAVKFGEHGYEVTVASSPAEGINIIERDREFDIILLDMIMPGMTGVELIERITQDYPDMQAKCIVLSNHGDENDIVAAKKAGAIGYIIKADTVPSGVVKKVEELSK